MTVTTMAPAAPGRTEPENNGGRSRRKQLALIGAVIIALAAGTWYQYLRPTDDTPQPGEVLALDAIQVNLAGGHYLRIGVALQLRKGAHDIDGSQALDATIETFSGLPVSELADPRDRRRLKAKLTEELQNRYDSDILEVFFTEFVTQ